MVRLEQLLDALATLQRTSGNLESSNDTYTKLLAVQKELKDAAGQAQTVAWIGANLEAEEAYEDALGRYAQAADLALEADDLRLAIAALRAEGELLRTLEQWEEAVGVYRRAVDLVAGEDSEKQIELLERLADIQRRAEDFDGAADTYAQLLELTGEIDEPASRAQVLAALANSKAQSGELNDALALYQEAQAAAKEGEDAILSIAILRATGALYTDLGQPADARAAFDAARVVAEEIGDTAKQISALKDVVALQKESEAFSAAIATYAEIQRLLVETGNAAGVAQVTAEIGTMYGKLGDTEKQARIL